MALLLKLHQVGGGVIVATPSLVPKNIDQKGRGVSGESFLGNQFLVADGALDEMPFAVLPFAAGGREIDPSLARPPSLAPRWSSVESRSALLVPRERGIRRPLTNHCPK